MIGILYRYRVNDSNISQLFFFLIYPQTFYSQTFKNLNRIFSMKISFLKHKKVGTENPSLVSLLHTLKFKNN